MLSRPVPVSTMVLLLLAVVLVGGSPQLTIAPAPHDVLAREALDADEDQAVAAVSLVGDVEPFESLRDRTATVVRRLEALEAFDDLYGG